MPLKHSSKKVDIAHNIEKEMQAGKPHMQAVAIAMRVAEAARKRGKKKKTSSGGKDSY